MFDDMDDKEGQDRHLQYLKDRHEKEVTALKQKVFDLSKIIDYQQKTLTIRDNQEKKIAKLEDKLCEQQKAIGRDKQTILEHKNTIGML